MTTDPQTLYCYNHPATPTTLRCNNCERPICPKCAVLTPTGYRCKECIRQQQKKFDTALWYDYIVAFVIGTVIAFLGGLLVNFLFRFLGLFIIILLFLAVGAAAGFIIAEAIRYATRRRRSNRLFRIAAISVIVGFLPIILYDLAISYWWGVLWVSLYAATTASSVYARLRGLRL